MSPYAGVFALTLVLGLVSLPTVVKHLGTEAWTSIALGQAIGGFAGVATGFGFDVFGPTAIAASRDGRRQYFADSLVARALALVGVSSITIPISIALGGEYALVTAITVFGACVGALGAGWVLIGADRPIWFALFDAGPRLVATASGLTAVALGASATTYALIGVAGSLAAVGAGIVAVTRLDASPVSAGRAVRSAMSTMRSQTGAVAVGGAAALYTAAPVVIVSAVAPGGLATYAVVDKLVRFTTAGLNVIVQMYQGWVPAPDDDATFAKRARFALRSNALIAVTVGVAFLPGAYFGARALTLGAIEPGLGIVVPLAIALGLISMSQVLGLVLLPILGRRRTVVLSTVAAATVGVPLAVMLTLGFGAQATGWSVVVVETMVLAIQTVVLRRTHLVRPAAATASYPALGPSPRGPEFRQRRRRGVHRRSRRSPPQLWLHHQS